MLEAADICHRGLACLRPLLYLASAKTNENNQLVADTGHK